MINSKKLLQLARKWRLAATIGRKRISFQKTSSNRNPNESNEVLAAVKKGHFVVYTIDGGRFLIPLLYLRNKVIIQLFAVAEEEFGLTGEGPIVLPIDVSSMTHVMSLIRRGSASEQEKAMSMWLSTCSRSYAVTTGQALPCTQTFLCV